MNATPSLPAGSQTQSIRFLEHELLEMDNPSLQNVLDVLTKLRASNDYSITPSKKISNLILMSPQPDVFTLQQIQNIAGLASLEAYRAGRPQASDAYIDIQRAAYLARMQNPNGVVQENRESVGAVLAE